MYNELEFVFFDEEVSNHNFGKFLFKPLHKGMGITLGNMFRRLLLTHLSSTSITSVRITNINNEFSTIKGVREDVLEILLNLRQIILKGFIQEKTYARLKIQGPSIITANSINFDLIPEITLVNPTQYIATVFDTSIIEMEFIIESDKNSTLIENKFPLNPLEFLTVEKVSSPIQRVIFEVNDILTTQDQEELILKVWTNGSITPLEAITTIAEIVQKFFCLINKDNLQIQKRKKIEN